MLISANNKMPKMPTNYICDKCDFICFKKSNYEKHLNTQKHINATNANLNNALNLNKKICSICNHNFKHASSLSRHKKKCLNIITISTNTISTNNYNNPLIEVSSNTAHEETSNEVTTAEVSYLTNLVLEIVKNNNEMQKQTNEIHKQHYELQKQNQEFQKQMLEVYKTNTTTNIHQNSHNKTFNLQFFLNEQCKDAMNIMDFVNSMTLEFADLEDVGKLGYVEGISKIIIRKLNELDVCKRPIHCSDAKREIMYVKDDNIWEKENSTYDKLRKAIKYVTKKNGDMLIPWSKMYPACMNTSHPLNDTYIQIMGQAMGGKEEFVDSENKIMKKIARAVLIDK